jgi:hypothetical protein
MTHAWRSYRRNRQFRVLVGLILLAGLLIQCQRVLYDDSTEASPVVIKGPVMPGPSVALAAPTVGDLRIDESIEARAARDPLAFLQTAIDRYDRSVRDYTCTFTKQEFVGGELSAEQVINAKFRQRPLSVLFAWEQNADKCDRVLYVEDAWVENGEQMAVVEPGAIARLFVSYVMRPIHGPDALKSSRRTIDQFGLRNSLVLAVKYCRLAEEQKVPARLVYTGNGEVNGRETLVFERQLPYTGEDGPWPDRILLLHLDKELLLPTLCLCYADDAKSELLGKYMMTDIELNPSLPDSVFTKKGMGLE